MKICSKCGIEKAITEFYKNSGNRCKQCHNLWMTAYHRQHPEKSRTSSRRRYHRYKDQEIGRVRNWQANHKERDSLTKFKYALRKYGISYETYCQMSHDQHGLCAICGVSSVRRLHVDHNHVTGQLRQLLCSNCNTALGLVDECTDRLIAMIAYIEKHGKKQVA